MPDLPFNELGVLFTDNPNPMWVYELSSLLILKVNKAAVARYGYNEKEFLALTIRDLRAVADVEAFENDLQLNKITDSKFKGISNAGIWKHKSKNEESIYAEITSHDIIFGDLNCRIVVAADAGEKMHYQEKVRLREQELAGAKNSLEALINNTEDQIWSVDNESRYVYMNRAYRNKTARLIGADPKEGDYSYQHAGYDDEIILRWEKYYTRALSGEIYTIIDESTDPITNQVLSFEVSFNPIYKTEGEITGIGCFARNITQRLKIEKALIEQNERLRYIASLTSHELRRPVASMLGLIAIMDRENFFNPDNKEIIEHLLTVGNEIDEVIRLIVDKTFTYHDLTGK
jgi:PAS domain S-box-containing protein